jgi:CubicO group peptidase (beta-lactamase class C family)
MFSFEDAYPVRDWDRWAGAAAGEFPGRCWQRYHSVEQAGWSEAALTDAQQYSQEIGSAAVMIVFGGAVLAHWGRIERRYKCHSMRKSLLSAIYGEHVARGTIDLEETLDSIGIDDSTPLTDTEKKARVGDLLKSRSGIYLPAAYEAPKAKKERPARGSHEPGSHWHYNDWDFNVLATVFNRKTGADVISEFTRQLAVPLQMQDFEPRHCHYHFEPHSSIHPAYPFRMSTRDLARLGVLYLRGGKWRDTRRIPPSWIIDSTRSYSAVPTGGYGYMWWVDGGHLEELGAYAAAGLGGHRLYVIPRAQLVIVHRADTYLKRMVGDHEIHRLLHKILRGWVRQPEPNCILVDMPEARSQERRTSVSALDLDQFCGEFSHGQIRATVRRFGDHLEIETPDGRFLLFPRSSTEFDIEDTEHRLDFVTDTSGKPVGLRIWWPYEMSIIGSASVAQPSKT